MLIRVSEIPDEGIQIEGADSLPQPFEDPAWTLEELSLAIEKDGSAVFVTGALWSDTGAEMTGRRAVGAGAGAKPRRRAGRPAGGGAFLTWGGAAPGLAGRRRSIRNGAHVNRAHVRQYLEGALLAWAGCNWSPRSRMPVDEPVSPGYR